MGFNTHAKAGSKLTEQTAPTVMLYLLLLRNLSSWRKNYVMDQGRRAVILGAVLCKYYKGRPNAQTYCIYNGWEPSLCQEMPSGAAGGPLTGLQQTG